MLQSCAIIHRERLSKEILKHVENVHFFNESASGCARAARATHRLAQGPRTTEQPLGTSTLFHGPVNLLRASVAPVSIGHPAAELLTLALVGGSNGPPSHVFS